MAIGGTQDNPGDKRSGTEPPAGRDLDAPPLSRGSVPAPVSPTSLLPPSTKDIDDKETRRNISYVLLALLALIVFAAFVALFYIYYYRTGNQDPAFKQLTELLNIVFGPVIALVSSVVGFYFGARTVTDAKAGV